MNRFTTVMLISALIPAYGLADAAPPQDAPSIIVHFADLDLTHGAGTVVLYQRLKSAAMTVCAAQNGRDLGSQTRYKMCLQSALDAAVSKVAHWQIAQK
jgi:UrcA family protein